MRILFVEPFGQHEGHPPAEAMRVTDALIEAGVDVTIVTFDGVRGNWIETSRIERHISIVPHSGPISWLFHLLISVLKSSMPLRFLADAVETAPTMFLAVLQSWRYRYNAIHIFDGNPSFVFAFLAALFARNQNFVVNIYAPPPACELKGGFQSFRKSLRRETIAASYTLCWLS